MPNTQHYINEARYHYENNNLEKSVACLNEAIENNVDNDKIHYFKGHILSSLGHLDDAFDAYTTAISINPNYVDAYTNRGNLYASLCQFETAINDYTEAMAVMYDDNPLVYYNYAHALWQTAQYDKALEYTMKSLDLDPSVKYSLGIIQLTFGNFDEGLENFENRYYSNYVPTMGLLSNALTIAKKQNPSLSLHDKSLVVYSEQGNGDFLQFIRYVKLLKNECNNITILTPKHLVKLLNNFDSDITITSDCNLLEYDYSCADMSLPYYFNTKLSSIPNITEYIKIENPHPKWESLIDNTKTNIGIAWFGNPAHLYDRKRSVNISQFKNILDLPFEFHSLQIDVRETDFEFLKSSKIKNYQQHLSNYYETASLIQHLDLIITVDTSVAHLASAMGKPVWLLISHVPDWRWFLDRSDSPWYPSVRLFRQPSLDNWDAVINNVVDELKIKFNI